LDSNAYKAFLELLDTPTQVNPFFGGGNIGGAQEVLGLIRFGDRIFDPVTGRWISMDRLGFDGGSFNWYEYVMNNPVKWTDPSGTSPRTGQDGGRVIICTGRTVKVVFDICLDGMCANGKHRIEVEAYVPNHYQTDPNLVDIDYVYVDKTNNPLLPWFHIGGYHGGIFSCILRDPISSSICWGIPWPDDGTGWPYKYGSDPRVYYSIGKMIALGYMSHYSSCDLSPCCCTTKSQWTNEEEYVDCQCDDIPPPHILSISWELSG
jgi:RHS repeat-associated protein